MNGAECLNKYVIRQIIVWKSILSSGRAVFRSRPHFHTFSDNQIYIRLDAQNQ